MIIPIRCFTCGSVIAGKWRAYERECAPTEAGPPNAPERAPSATQVASDNGTRLSGEVDKGAVMDKLGIRRICCRRHFLGNVDLMDDM